MGWAVSRISGGVWGLSGVKSLKWGRLRLGRGIGFGGMVWYEGEMEMIG